MSRFVTKQGLAFFYQALKGMISAQTDVIDITEELTIPLMEKSGVSFYYVNTTDTTIPKTGASVLVLPESTVSTDIFILNLCNKAEDDTLTNTFILYDTGKMLTGIATTSSAGTTTAGTWTAISGSGGSGSGSGDMQELTLAQYNALTTAEKNNGTVYFITDADGSTQNYAPIAGVEISQADYDRLTPAQKNDGTLYLITDENPSDQLYAPVAGVEITLEEYEELTSEEKNNGTMYLITDGEPDENTYAPVAGTEISQADYDQLPTAKKNNDVLYLITDSDDEVITASQIVSTMRVKGEITSENLPATGTEKDFYYLTDTLEGKYYQNGKWKTVI